MSEYQPRRTPEQVEFLQEIHKRYDMITDAPRRCAQLIAGTADLHGLSKLERKWVGTRVSMIIKHCREDQEIGDVGFLIIVAEAERQINEKSLSQLD